MDLGSLLHGLQSREEQERIKREKIASKARNELVAQWKQRKRTSTAHKAPGLSHDPWRRRPTERPYLGLRAHLDARQQQRPIEETKVGRRARTLRSRTRSDD